MMLRNWLKKLIGTTPQETGSEARLSQERETQALRLELVETQARLQALQAELDRQRQQAANLAGGQAQAQIEGLLAEIARPTAQFITQIHLAEQQGKDIQGRDVLAVARTLWAALQDYGLAQEGEIGQVLPFDPDRHASLSAEGLPNPGQPVVIRFAGLSYHGRQLCKAGVTPASLTHDDRTTGG